MLRWILLKWVLEEMMRFLIFSIVTMLAFSTGAYAMCFKTNEEIHGLNRICYYNCLGSMAASTVSITSLCPISMNN